MKSQDFAPDPYTTGARKVCALLLERFKGTELERNLGAAASLAMALIEIETQLRQQQADASSFDQASVVERFDLKS